MAAWGTTDLTLISFGGTNYYFAPNELVYAGSPMLRLNQVVQESESGEQVVQQLDDNEREFYQFSIFKMPAADRTVGGNTIRGYDSLRTLLETTIPMRANTVSLAPTSVPVISAVTARLQQSEFPATDWYFVDRSGNEYYGRGGAQLVFRKEI